MSIGMGRRLLLQTAELTIADVCCDGEEISWSRPELTHSLDLVLVRRGLFQRRVAGVVILVDPTCGYIATPDSVAQFAHPRGGDACTSIEVSPTLASALLGGDPEISDGALPTTGPADLDHRAFVARARQGAGHDELAEEGILLVAQLLGSIEPRRLAAGRPATERTRRRLVDEAREALHDNPSRRLADLAGHLGVSPYHLSRVFRRITGTAIHQYRMRLRVRRAVELLAEGETNLAGVAAEVGFADQAHLTRVLHAELGTTPARVRALLCKTPRRDGRLTLRASV